MASSETESGSSEMQSKAFKRNLLFELYYAQKEAARFLELAYLALKEDPILARKVRKTADDAQNQHMRTHGLIIGYQDTAKHVVESMMPLFMKALEKKKVELIQKILEKVLGYVNRMIKETKDTKDRYYAIKGEVQDQISDIVYKNKEVKSMKTDIELEAKQLKELLLSRKVEYDLLQVKIEKIAEEIKGLKKKHLDYLDKSTDEIDEKSLEKACQELGKVGGNFAKIVFFWENLAVKLNTLIEEKDIVEVLLEEIHDENFIADLDESTNNITEVWSSFRMVCSYYVNTSEREIHDLYSFLSDPVDQLSLEDCKRRKEKVLAKMEDEVKTLKL